MNDKTSLKEVIQSLIPVGSGILVGIVSQISPLQITITNDSKLILTTNSLVISKHLTDYSIEYSSTESEDIRSITIYNSLKLNEYVYLLPFNNDKQYYVLDKKG